MTTPYFLTTTIPYVNGRPHLGHALEFVQTDSFARFHRARGEDVLFLTGADENSLKNVLAAEAEGITTHELVDRNVELFLRLHEKLGISFDRFIRTSVDEWHARGATEIWRRIAAGDNLYKRSYTGLYCVGCEQFYLPEELVDGRCPEHGTIPEMVSEENWFFRLSRYAEPLLREIREGRLRIIPDSRRNEIVSFVERGLEDISVSRSQERARGWGVPVPDDPTQVMYVWIDALANYVTALHFADDHDDYRRWWVDNPNRVHTLGKGVIRFHAVYWPAMLLAAGLPLPTTLFVHGYVTSEGQKLSKSLGVQTDVEEIVDTYGVDAVRYYLLGQIPPTLDADFREEELVRRYNNELANDLGNLVSRTATMIERYCGGVVPSPGDAQPVLAETVAATYREVDAAMAEYDHREGLQSAWRLVRRANAYVTETRPWDLAKDEANEETLSATLFELAEVLRHIAASLVPFVPAASATILARLGEDESTPREWSPTLLVGRAIEAGEPLFPRLVLS
jgi:methionyl-tRNA synthetase